ncbi:DUF4189 domain-containing protein [Bradyrhizobium sp. LTSP857]|uniref:DUF4189 domain-containing protein n=1 Tax=Bradyrhizobium sp. LTSP857 TaxID=1619231 RepID=UPI0009E45816|nr:DUF4189 domain-containing protein [Bradyrhizobium sp. LTSP857]
MFYNRVRGFLGAGLIHLVLVCSLHAQSADQNKFVVDGLPLGGKVRAESPVYKQYDCAPSTQYRELTFCKRVSSEAKLGSKLTTTTSILHSADGTVGYVNQFLEPATFSRSDIDAELARLSTKFGERARVQEAPKRPGIPQALIASWGSLNLEPLADADMAVLRGDRSPGKGILVDFLGDFTRSAQANMPVFRIQGNFGYVWAANFDAQGRGSLRFFAINAARLQTALAAPDSQVQRPSSTSQQTAQPNGAALTRQLEECGNACPDKPELDKLRRDTLEQLEQAREATDDANKFTSAINDEQALIAYISECYKCSYRAEAQANLDTLRTSRTNKVFSKEEERQYRAARGNTNGLRQYVAQCKVCEFARDALSEINSLQPDGSDSLFDLEICSKEYLPVYVAFAGQRDPNLDMWTSEGWYKIDSGQCSTIAKLRKGSFFLTAHNKRGAWAGKESYCTVPDRAFTVVLLPQGGDCLDGEESVGFDEIRFTGPKYTWTLNAKPWSYNALAYSPFNNSWGWSGSQSSSSAAIQNAIAACSNYANDCRLARSVRDDLCLALAEGTNNDGGTVLGWATGDNYASARQAARQACNDIGSGCVVTKQSCSP